MSVYAANNLFRGVKKYSNSGGALLGGVIANSVSSGYEKAIVDDFAERTATRVMQYIPRSVTVTRSELHGKTVIEAAPDSKQADVYRALAKRIDRHEESSVPSPLDAVVLREWGAGWADRILSMEDDTSDDATNREQ
jgi:nitrogenase iron protein NifH